MAKQLSIFSKRKRSASKAKTKKKPAAKITVARSKKGGWQVNKGGKKARISGSCNQYTRKTSATAAAKRLRKARKS